MSNRTGSHWALAAQIAWRYLFEGRRRFAAFITWTSVAGLALGVIVLTVVVSVMNGFDRELKSRLLGTIPHVLIANHPSSNARAIAAHDLPDISDAKLAKPAQRFFSGSGMVTQNGLVTAVGLYALDNLGLAAATAPGEIFQRSGLLSLASPATAEEPDFERKIVLGAPLARHLGLFPGDSLALVLSEPTATGIKPQLYRFELAGTFEIGAELDNSLAFVHLDNFSAQQWQRLGKLGWRMELTDPLQAAAVVGSWRNNYPKLNFTSWNETYGEFFRAVALEKSLMFLVLLMVVAVASFNIVSGQFMVVGEKAVDIAILRTMGAHGALIRRVFILQGIFIASIGILAGLAIGVLAAANVATLVQWLGSVTSYRLLEGTYFTDLPSQVQWQDLVTIALMSWVLCVLATLLPARRAANLNPIQTLH